MKFLNNLWPWKELARLNGEIDFLKRTLEHEQTSHNLTRASLQDHKLELIDHRSRVSQGQKDIRKLATILAMRGGITILFLFLYLSAFAQPILRQTLTTNTLALAPSTSYFLGWNGTQPAWGIPSGSQLWTNDSGQTWLLTPTNQVFLGDISQLGVFAADMLEVVATNDSSLRGVQITKTINGSASSRFGLQVILNGTPTSGGVGTTDGAINGSNQAGGINNAGSTYYADGAIGLDGISGNNVDGVTHAAFGTSGYANGREGLLVGVIGEADASINGTTNVGGLFNVLTEGKSGVFVGTYLEARSSPVADGSDDPKFEDAVLLVDGRETGISPIVVRTNNGDHIFTVDRNGATTALSFNNAGGDVSANATNNDKLFGLNATNQSLLIGLNATNESLLIGLNGTNANTLLGSNATNNDSASALAITNGAINNLTNNIATKQIDSLNTANFVTVEEFPGSSANSLTIGTHGWRSQNSAGGSVSIGAGAANHPGICNITTGTVSGEGALISLATTNSTSVNPIPSLSAITGWTNVWVFQLSATNDMVMYLGMVNNLVFLSTEPADWIGLKVDSTSLNAYQYVSRTGGSSTTANGPTLDTATWHTFRMWSTGAGTVNCTLDAGGVNPLAAIPNVTLGAMAMVRKSAINNTVTLKVDYYSFVMTGLSR